MKEIKDTNFLENSDQEYIKKSRKKYKRIKRKFIVKTALFLFLIIFIISIILLSNIAAHSESKFAKAVKKNFIIKQISHLISADIKKLKGEENKRTNILILGMGGENHDGPLLTDTIIVLSYNYETNETSMVSIPRDMLMISGLNEYKKINYLYTYGEYSNEYNGLSYSKEIISKNIGIPIHYTVSIDFFGFKEIVDALGGINIYIENSFIDYNYPTEDHKVTTIEFEKGYQHLSGIEALQFARSRHGLVTEGSGFEASDFARSERQFKIIEAIKNKILSFSTLTNPNKVIKLFKILNKYIKTDIESWETIRFVEVLKSMKEDKIFNKVLTDAPDNLLRSTTSTIDGAFILIPKDNDYNSISSFFNGIFETEKIEKEQASIQILNGTKQNGLAGIASKKLISLGLNVIRIDNAPNQNTSTTIIYDLSKNTKPETLKIIQNNILGIRSNLLPDKLKNYLYFENIDFLIVLGKDQLQQ